MRADADLDANLTEEGRKTRSEYLRRWRREHPGKQREYSNTYWSKRATKEVYKEKERNIKQ